MLMATFATWNNQLYTVVSVSDITEEAHPNTSSEHIWRHLAI